MSTTRATFESERPKEVGRREVVLLLIGWLGSLGSLGALAAAGLRGLAPNLLDEPNARFRLDRPEDYPDGGVVFIDEIRIFVLRKGNAFRALSATCSHLGCTVNHAGKEGYTCPCHGSRFDGEGKVLDGPAPTALAWLEMQLARDGRLIVDRSNSVEPSSYLVLGDDDRDEGVA